MKVKVKVNSSEQNCQPITIDEYNYLEVLKGVEQILLQGVFPIVSLKNAIEETKELESLSLLRHLAVAGFKFKDAVELLEQKEVEIDLNEYFNSESSKPLAIIISEKQCEAIPEYLQPKNVEDLFESSKVLDGFSTTFRQWRAEGTHCKYIHGYGISFELVFQGALDEKNWVYDFGFSKRLKIKTDKGYMIAKDWFNYMFDHTTVIAETDPELELFKEMDKKGIIQLRILPEVGCEMFAKFVYDKLNPEILKETKGRVQIKSVTCREHFKNSATYKTK